MYIDNVPNRNSPPAILLRECWREGGKVRKRTLANMSKWPPHVIDAVRRSIKGERLASVDDVFSITRSLPHGHVDAILGMIKRLGLDRLIASKRCRERDLVVGMIVARLIHPASKLATTRYWETTSLATELDLEGADVDEMYQALHWLNKRQKGIEKKLAERHLKESEPVLYDVSSSYYEGRTCPLTRFGYSRDHRSDRPQIVYGLMTDRAGCPVAVEVYPGHTGDPTTVPDQVEKMRERFGLTRITLVGDRGMLTQTQIESLREYPELRWISALRTEGIRKLLAQGQIDPSLFDKRNLAEIAFPDYPGERLVVCFNPLLADERKRKRAELLAATEEKLERIARQVQRRTKKQMTKDEIALKVGTVIGRFKMKKHFVLKIDDGLFEYERNEESINNEERLDGIYVIRTSEPEEEMSAEDAVRTYKSLSQVERAFRCLKGVDLRIRPIFHRLEESVQAHVFLCVLAYYVEWHIRRALAQLLFEDEELDTDRAERDPVAPAEASASARRKKATRQTEDGLPVHDFATLLQALGTQCKNYCRPQTHPSAEPVEMITEPTPLQKRARELLDQYPVTGN